MLVVCWIAAVVACLSYGVGSVLQSIGARRAADTPGVSGFALIVVQAPFLLGLGVDALGFVANVVALQRLPLFLVQSILTGSVGVTAVVSALRGSPLGRKDWASLAVLVAGLALLAASASAETAVELRPGERYLVLASVVIPVALGFLGSRGSGRTSSLVTAFAAGLAFSGLAVASRGLSGEPVGWHLLANPLLWAVAVSGAAGMVFFALALRRGAVTSVTAVTFMVEMMVPSAIGLLLLGDSVHPGWTVPAALGFGLAVLGTISLLRFAE